MAKAKKLSESTEAGAGGEGIMARAKRKSVSKSEKAGLSFPVARVNKYLKKNSGLKRVGGSAPVYATAIVEYVVSELLDVAGNVTSAAGRKTVSPEDLMKGLRGDKELAKLFAGHSIFVGEKLGKISDAISYNEKTKTVKSGEGA